MVSVSIEVSEEALKICIEINHNLKILLLYKSLYGTFCSIPDRQFCPSYFSNVPQPSQTTSNWLQLNRLTPKQQNSCLNGPTTHIDFPFFKNQTTLPSSSLSGSGCLRGGLTRRHTPTTSPDFQGSAVPILSFQRTMLPSPLLQAILLPQPSGKAGSKEGRQIPTLAAEGQVQGLSFFASSFSLNSMQQLPSRTGFLKTTELCPKLPTNVFDPLMSRQGGLAMSLVRLMEGRFEMGFELRGAGCTASWDVTDAASSSLARLEACSVSISSDCRAFPLAFFFSFKASLLLRWTCLAILTSRLSSSVLWDSSCDSLGELSLTLVFCSIIKLHATIKGSSFKNCKKLPVVPTSSFSQQCHSQPFYPSVPTFRNLATIQQKIISPQGMDNDPLIPSNVLLSPCRSHLRPA